MCGILAQKTGHDLPLCARSSRPSRLRHRPTVAARRLRRYAQTGAVCLSSIFLLASDLCVFIFVQVEMFEKELSDRLRQMRVTESHIAGADRDRIRPREVWIDGDGRRTRGEAEDQRDKLDDQEMLVMCNETAAEVRWRDRNCARDVPYLMGKLFSFTSGPSTTCCTRRG